MRKWCRLVGVALSLFWTSAFANTDEATQPTTTDALLPAETILVAGSTGQTGRLVVEQLAETNYITRAMTRSRARAVELFGESDDWVEADVRSK